MMATLREGGEVFHSLAVKTRFHTLCLELIVSMEWYKRSKRFSEQKSYKNGAVTYLLSISSLPPQRIISARAEDNKVKRSLDERSVSNAYNVSDVSVNPENMAEVQAFIRLLPKDDLKLSIVDSKPLALANGVSEKDDFFVHTPRKTIAEVLESKQVEKCIVMATIAGIDSDMGWYYLSCKVCAKKVITVPSDNCDDGDEHDVLACNYYCPKCKTNSPKLLPRFRILMCCPPILNDLKGKTFLFKIGIEKENFVYKHDTFKVVKIITNLGMINEFEAAQSPTGSENLLSWTFSTQSDAPERSLMIQGGSSGSTDLTPAKRTRTPIINLEEAFDQNSVTKMACTIKIGIEKENFVYKHDTFKVVKIITNLGMINEFEAAQSPTGSENLLSWTFSTQSDAPERSLMIQGGSSGSTDLTPAKRTRTPIINLEEAFDQNSVTKMACTIKVKKEKLEKSG
ncbi:hypothetical protein F2Q68_00031310 [Brassica cretica]|uniref:Replication factor A C-terminal domain-containing protein n=1 Tax=Brassica cretica TaxID=69181 RepID=A0A8S9GB68_BRACR|nr:hypothetical protein F2Q68_00031310 [Brassica cretica]